jgi:hypothetical protein
MLTLFKTPTRFCVMPDTTINLNVSLPAPVRDALADLARREYRSMRAQAAVILAAHVAECGQCSDLPVSDPAAISTPEVAQ